MKALLIALSLVFSSTAFARQYFQCSLFDSYANDGIVINLETEEAGTLFLTAGVETDDHLLVKVALDSVEKGLHTYKVVDEAGEGSITIPSDVIGKKTNFTLVHLNFADRNVEFSCFARIYND